MCLSRHVRLINGRQEQMLAVCTAASHALPRRYPLCNFLTLWRRRIGCVDTFADLVAPWRTFKATHNLTRIALDATCGPAKS